MPIIRQIQYRTTPPERLEDGWLRWTPWGWDLRFYDPVRVQWIPVNFQCEQAVHHEFLFRREVSPAVDKAVDDHFKVKGKERTFIAN